LGVYIEALVYMMQGELSKALETFNRLISNPYILDTRVALDAYGGLYLIHQIQGNQEKILQIEDKLTKFASKTHELVYISLAHSFRSRGALMAGDLTSARKLQQRVDVSLDEESMLIWLEIPRLTACRVQVAEGTQISLQKAIDSLLTYKDQNLQNHHPYQVMMIQPLLALAYYKLGSEEKALAILGEALELGKPGGWVWPFVEAGPQIAILLRKLLDQGVAVDYVQRILDDFPTHPEAPPFMREEQDRMRALSPPAQLIEPLTRREMETLRFLALDLTTAEIAEEMVVSVETVRSHSKSIYSKLDVHSRYQAVQRATELALI
jgi:LuxR family maltose regulon positive regulatory protein